ncbi:MAG TPA: glycerophosphodiester phosphodiesterase [Alphaproteobacteria bacterium]|nr:glycerophosphodiester phosphodiesterase [Alphaproteobacteria bacterium]
MSLFLPKVIGHRGAALHAPENTLAGFRKAAALGARMVEFDVKLTRDGVPVVIHDATADRTTNGTGAVRDMDLADLRRLDAGARFPNPAFRGERVPTLEETLRLCLDLDLAINIEIKPCPGREAETAEVALAEARRLWPNDRPLPLVSSFALASLRQAMESAPDWPRGYLIWNRPADWLDHVAALRPATLNIGHERETPESIDAYRATGLPLIAYTVNEPVRARELFDLGVAAVFSDAPDAILAAV